MMVLWIALYTLLGVLGLVLLVPFHLAARGVLSDARVDGRVEVRWALGLLILRAQPADGLTLRLLGIRIWRRRPPSAADREARKAKRAEKQTRRADRRAAKLPADAGQEQAPWWRRMGGGPPLRDGLHLLRTSWRLLPLRGQIRGALGLSDPSDTGAVFTVLDPIARRARTIELNIEPVWIDSEVDLNGWITLRLWPIEIIAKIIWHLIWDARIRRTVWAVVRRR